MNEASNPKPMGEAFAFDNSYARLPDIFFAPVDPTPVEAPRLIKFNRALAQELGLDADALERHGAGYFSGNVALPGGLPLAMAYAGHQFGHFVAEPGRWARHPGGRGGDDPQRASGATSS
jgi:uncharacterized protein YdiU (UPF0061 family)